MQDRNVGAARFSARFSVNWPVNAGGYPRVEEMAAFLSKSPRLEDELEQRTRSALGPEGAVERLSVVASERAVDIVLTIRAPELVIADLMGSDHLRSLGAAFGDDLASCIKTFVLVGIPEARRGANAYHVTYTLGDSPVGDPDEKEIPEVDPAPPGPDEIAASTKPASQAPSGPTQVPKVEAVGEERMPIQADDPARKDELERLPFAQVLASRITEAWISGSSGGSKLRAAFMIHIDGPWGSGKTSLLNLLCDELKHDRRATGQNWIVVNFNAWQNQRILPPWWTLIKAIYDQSKDDIYKQFKDTLHEQSKDDHPQRHLVRLWLCWSFWRFRMDWVPVIVSLILTAMAIFAAFRLFVWSGSSSPNNNPFDLAFKLVTLLLAAPAAVFSFTRSLLFGSAQAAQTYTTLRSDPLAPIARLFESLIRIIRAPVVVFIDDFDRCRSEYVVETLEGIQTLLRGVPLIYVVAADRKWICSSFEQTYSNFGTTVGTPGRPLGYLFLDKLFQVSTRVPRLTGELRKKFWDRLLSGAASGNPLDLERQRIEAERQAEEELKGLHTYEELEARISKVREDPVRELAMRAVAAKQITGAAAVQHTEHRLLAFADLLEPNPRSMKRIANAIGMQQAIQFLEGRRVSPEALARWTIIDLRWPALAEFLVANPDRISEVAAGAVTKDSSIPEPLQSLLQSGDVTQVVIGGPPSGRLDEPTIREIIGERLPSREPAKEEPKTRTAKAF